MTESLGFIGLGVMGQPMAGHLAQHCPLIVYNRTRTRCQPLLDQGAQAADSPRAVAESCRVIFLMLKNDEAVCSVTDGDSGLFSGLKAGTVIVDHSTISPALTRTLAARAAEHGAVWLDAPVTGGDIGARNGTLTIMIGGPKASVDAITPYLNHMAARIVHVGAVGQGQTLKLVSNMVSGITLMAAAEGIAMGLALGLDLDDLETVMQNGTAQSFELGKVLDRYKARNYSPGFSVENRYKDLRLAVELAHPRLAAVVLAHLSRECNRPELARSVAGGALASRRWKGYLAVAPQDDPTEVLAPEPLRLRAGPSQLSFL